MAAGGLRSTANDMLKCVSANLGLTHSALTPLMARTHAIRFQGAAPSGYVNIGGSIGLAWFVVSDPRGRKTVRHGGTSGGYNSFVGLDLTRRCGVVVLSNSVDILGVHPIGNLLLASEWRSEQRPERANVISWICDYLVGQYELLPDFALGMLTLRQYLLAVPKAVICIPAGICLAVILVLFWRARSFRMRCIILGGATVVAAALAITIPLVLSHRVCAIINPKIVIFREGDRILARCTFSLSPEANKLPPFPLPIDLWPGTPIELLPESESRFFNRLTGMPVTFFQDKQGNVIRLTAHACAGDFSFAKFSNQPP